MANSGVAPGSSRDHCSAWPSDGHAMATHVRGGALVSIQQCVSCNWIDFADIDEQIKKIIADAGPTIDPEWRAVALTKWRHYRDVVVPGSNQFAFNLHSYWLAKLIPHLLGMPEEALKE